MASAIKGLFIGSLIGALAGLGTCVWLITETLLFPGDTMLFGAVVCGTCGFIWGESFIEWLKEHWHHFT